MERGFREKELKKTMKQVEKMDRNEWLKLNAIPSILKNNFHLISNDPTLLKYTFYFQTEA